MNPTKGLKDEEAGILNKILKASDQEEVINKDLKDKRHNITVSIHHFIHIKHSPIESVEANRNRPNVSSVSSFSASMRQISNVCGVVLEHMWWHDSPIPMFNWNEKYTLSTLDYIIALHDNHTWCAGNYFLWSGCFATTFWQNFQLLVFPPIH